MSGPRALCVGPPRSLSGPSALCVGPRRSASAPGAASCSAYKCVQHCSMPESDWTCGLKHYLCRARAPCVRPLRRAALMPRRWYTRAPVQAAPPRATGLPRLRGQTGPRPPIRSQPGQLELPAPVSPIRSAAPTLPPFRLQAPSSKSSTVSVEPRATRATPTAWNQSGPLHPVRGPIQSSAGATQPICELQLGARGHLLRRERGIHYWPSNRQLPARSPVPSIRPAGPELRAIHPPRKPPAQNHVPPIRSAASSEPRATHLARGPQFGATCHPSNPARSILSFQKRTPNLTVWGKTQKSIKCSVGVQFYLRIHMHIYISMLVPQRSTKLELGVPIGVNLDKPWGSLLWVAAILNLTLQRNSASNSHSPHEIQCPKGSCDTAQHPPPFRNDSVKPSKP